MHNPMWRDAMAKEIRPCKKKNTWTIESFPGKMPAANGLTE